MWMKILNVVYLLVAVTMVALILLQRGAGAAAGAGFGGGGASGSVFGAQGAANFLSKTTKWFAIIFFGISLFMAWSAAHQARSGQRELGVMARAPQAASVPPPSPPTAPNTVVPQAAPSSASPNPGQNP